MGTSAAWDMRAERRALAALLLFPRHRNPGVPTIEQEVFDACVKAGAISADNSDNVNKVRL